MKSRTNVNIISHRKSRSARQNRAPTPANGNREEGGTPRSNAAAAGKRVRRKRQSKQQKATVDALISEVASLTVAEEEPDEIVAVQEEETPAPPSFSVTGVGEELGHGTRPSNFKPKLGIVGRFRKKSKICWWKVRRMVARDIYDDEGRVDHLTGKIDKARNDLYNSNVTNAYLTLVDSQLVHRTETRVYRQGGIPTNLVDTQDMVVDERSADLMFEVRSLLGNLALTDDNWKRVYAMVAGRYKDKISKGVDAFVQLSPYGAENIIKNATMMFFIPSSEDLVRDQLIRRDPGMSQLVARNNELAGSRQLA